MDYVMEQKLGQLIRQLMSEEDQQWIDSILHGVGSRTLVGAPFKITKIHHLVMSVVNAYKTGVFWWSEPIKYQYTRTRF